MSATSVAQPVDVDDDDLVTAWSKMTEGFVKVRARLREDLQHEANLPGPWFETLLRLHKTPGQRMPISQLAREVSFSSGGFTKFTDRLVQEGLVARTASPTDRRVTYATLTERGEQVVQAALRIHAEGLRRYVVQVLGSEGFEEFGELMRSLRESRVPDIVPPRSATA